MQSRRGEIARVQRAPGDPGLLAMHKPVYSKTTRTTCFLLVCDHIVPFGVPEEWLTDNMSASTFRRAAPQKSERVLRFAKEAAV